MRQTSSSTLRGRGLTRIRLHLAIYFWALRGTSTDKGCEKQVKVLRGTSGNRDHAIYFLPLRGKIGYKHCMEYRIVPDRKQPKLLDRVRQTLRVNRYSPRTETAYIDWIKRYVRFHGVRHPQEMEAEEVKAFLSHLATQMKVAASTQNQAFSALLFLYQRVLKQRLPWIDDIVRASRPKKVPVVFPQDNEQRMEQNSRQNDQSPKN